MRKYKLLIAGSRSITDYDFIADRLDFLTIYITQAEDTQIEVIEGEAPGVDRLARKWAEERGHAFDPHPAEWERPDGTKNRKAGFERNARMVALKPDGAILFWDGASRGTQDTLNLVVDAGIEYRVVRPDNSL